VYYIIYSNNWGLQIQVRPEVILISYAYIRKMI